MPCAELHAPSCDFASFLGCVRGQLQCPCLFAAVAYLCALVVWLTPLHKESVVFSQGCCHLLDFLAQRWVAPVRKLVFACAPLIGPWRQFVCAAWMFCGRAATATRGTHAVLVVGHACVRGGGFRGHTLDVQHTPAPHMSSVHYCTAFWWWRTASLHLHTDTPDTPPHSSPPCCSALPA